MASKTQASATTQKDKGVYIIAIGVGSGADFDELIGMASEPKTSHYTTLGTFTELKALSAAIAGSCIPEIPKGAGFRVDDPQSLNRMCTGAARVERMEGRAVRQERTDLPLASARSHVIRWSRVLLGGVLARRARAGHLFLTIPHPCLFLPPSTNNLEYLLAASKNLAFAPGL